MPRTRLALAVALLTLSPSAAWADRVPLEAGYDLWHAIQPCYAPPAERYYGSAMLHLVIDAEGNVVGVPKIVERGKATATSGRFVRAMLRAIDACAPYPKAAKAGLREVELGLKFEEN